MLSNRKSKNEFCVVEWKEGFVFATPKTGGVGGVGDAAADGVVK